MIILKSKKRLHPLSAKQNFEKTLGKGQIDTPNLLRVKLYGHFCVWQFETN